ncbi:MAG: sigma-70 family RNA polymerase sigma factor [Sedimentisphaerales bacterium]|nr:sigma-70 family RNA polymerase sigma factor [Sedimentisphaerales bacterium]
MSEKTRSSLLKRLLDPADSEAWNLFDERYRPIILSFAHRLGLQEADAEDAAQKTLIGVRKTIASYDRPTGRFRNWLLTIVRRSIGHTRKELNPKRMRQPVDGSGTRVLERVPDHRESALEQLWQEEWKRHIWQECRRRLARDFPEKHIVAFELCKQKELTAKEAGLRVGLSEAAVHKAVSRMLRRLRIWSEEWDLW